MSAEARSGPSMRRRPHLEVPPRVVFWSELGDDARELGRRHLWKVIVVDNCAAARLIAADNVAACGLGMT
ncbi:hypothetical protein C2W62_51525 [Candidatus Entotheonella serta]|nr:hypothetical protein C2W62_51525 [Candidatus Entotheonella serta]